MRTPRSALGVAIAVATALLLFGCSGAQSRYASHMKRAQGYFSAGDFSKASVEVRNAMQILPKDAAARLLAGRAAEKLGRLREAAGLYQSVVDSTPDNSDARVGLGRLLVLGGLPEQAKKIIEAGLARHPDDPELLTWRGAARARLKDHAGAIADVDRALQIAPENPDAIAERAGLYQQDGQVEKATALVSAAVKRAPDSVDLHQILASLFTQSGHPGDAEGELRALVQLAPQETRYRNDLAMFYVRTRRIDDAQHVLEDAVNALSESDEAKLALVQFIGAQRSPAEAAKALRGFITQNPDSAELRLALGALLEATAANADAIVVYEDVVRRERTGPNSLRARDRLARIAYNGSRNDEAQKLIGEVLAANPQDADALLLRAQIALVKQDLPAAIKDLRTVLRDQPQASGVRLLLARAFVTNGDPALAEDTLRQGLDTSRTDGSLQVELGQLLARTGRADQAVTLLQQTAQRTPEDPEVRVALARAYLAKGDFAGARATADEIDRLRPKLPAGAFLAGVAAEAANQPDEARRQYERALAIAPDSFDTISALARMQIKRGQIAAAVALVKSAADRDARNAPLLNLLGQMYLAQKSLPLADAALARATQEAPTWWVPYRNLALVKVAAHDVPGAIAAYEAGVKVAPGEPQIAAELSYFYQKHGRIDDAIALYEELHRLSPRAQAVANNLAMLLVTYKTDRASLDRARDLTAGFDGSTDGALLDTTGWVHFKRAEYSQALPLFQRALQRDPDSKEIRCHLGLAELHGGQADRARADLEAALSGTDAFSGSEEGRSALAALRNRAG